MVAAGRPEVAEARVGLLRADTARDRATPGGFVQSLLASRSLQSTTRLRRRPGIRCHRHRDDDGVSLIFLDCRMSFDASHEAAAEVVARSSSFVLSELPGLPSSDAIGFVQRLVRAGLLLVDEIDGPR